MSRHAASTSTPGSVLFAAILLFLREVIKRVLDTTNSVIRNSYIPSAREVFDLKVERPRPLNQILPKHEVYNYFVSHP